MTKVRDDAGSAGVRDRAATARGGERGSRFCRTKKRKMLRPLARALRSAELGDRSSLRRADLRMVLLAVRERFVPGKGGLFDAARPVDPVARHLRQVVRGESGADTIPV